MFDLAQHVELLHCKVEDGDTFRAATIFRSKVSPRDVVIWYDGSKEYEGLSGGYTFDSPALRDADGGAIRWRLKTEPQPRGTGLLGLYDASTAR